MTAAAKTSFIKKVKNEAFNRQLNIVDLVVNKSDADAILWHNVDKIAKELTNKKPRKIYFLIHATFKKPVKNVEDTEPSIKPVEDIATEQFLSTEPSIVLTSTKNQIFHRLKGEFATLINNAIFNSRMEGSGFSLKSINSVSIAMARYEPLSGSSYLPLPPYISNKKAIINIQNSDNMCFMWAILAKLHPANVKPERVSKYRDYTGELNFDDIKFPVKLYDISKFEELNDLTVNVYSYDEISKIYPAHVSPKSPRPRESEDRHIDLFLTTTGDNSHYSYIKNFSRFVFGITKHNSKKHVCKRCLQHFNTEDKWVEHGQYCNQSIKVEMPMPGSKLQFTNFHRQMKAPFIVYADFESILVPIDEEKGKHTIVTQEHIVCSYAYVIVRCDGQKSEIKLYKGEDASVHFLKEMRKECSRILDVIKSPTPLDLSVDEEEHFQRADTCWICQKKTDGDKVRDHCHITGEYRGPAHSNCNLKLALKPATYTLPIFFHNLKGYDSHIILHALKDEWGKVTCIAHTMEKYMSFRLDKLVFYDSLQHLPSSIAKLAESLTSFPITEDEFKEKSSLVLKKGVYPYEYMTDFDRFDLDKLPPIGRFYSSLKDEDISDEDYAYAQKVWKEMECKTMGDYHDVYLKTDVCLLADIFENYRKTSLGYYCLDPAQYYTSPGMSWDAFLKSSEVKLDLISDQDMFMFIEQGMRGGVSMASSKYAKANNPYTPNYDPSKPTNYIMYFDMNNLYGCAMTENLPISNFGFIDNPSIEDILTVTKDGEWGAFVEVDLEYPPELHDEHNDFPLAAERIKGDDGQEKLIPNFNTHYNYVCHYRLLQYYVKKGLKVTKVHRTLTFKQKPFMNDYIMQNTHYRKCANTDFEKDYFKLMNNACFGKTMENVRSRKDIRLVTSDKQVKRLVAKPNFASFKIFSESFAAISMKKTKVMLNKPIYVGMTILELSKLRMYEWYYDYFRPRYPGCKVLYTDTDSLIIDIPTEDIYKELNPADFDTSNYPRDHPLFSDQNKKELGFMKDEMGGKPIIEYVGLRAKMYSVKTKDNEMKKAKGISKRVVDSEITHADYKRTLETGVAMTHKNTSIVSNKHQLKTQETKKISLQTGDNKRVNEDITIGHYSLFAI